MDKNTIILIVVVVILAISLMNTQLPTSEDKNLSNYTIGKDKNPINDTVKQTNSAYLQWAEVTSKSMKSYVTDIANATNVGNYSNLTIIGSSLKRDATMSLDQSRYLEFSVGLESSMKEIQNALEDYIIVGEYVEIGGKNRDDERLINASNYAKDAAGHMVNATFEVGNYMRSLK